MLEFFENLNFAAVVSVKHMMSLLSLSPLADSKSIACLLKDLILSSVVTSELLSTPSILVGNKCILNAVCCILRRLGDLL